MALDMYDCAENRAKFLKDDFEKREEAGKNLLKFGVDFLDDALYGIGPHEVILIGAESGAGKTQLVSNIAKYNISQGKNVHMFALEAHDLEIEHRIIFQIFIGILQKKGHKNWPSYEEYYYRHHEFHVEELEAQQIFSDCYRTLSTFYRTKSQFTSEDFIQLYAMSAVSKADLIIVDHAHYFDWGEKSDYEGLKDVITKVRHCADTMRVPCLLVAHMRKPDLKVKQLAPSMHDFHGTSELYKKANKALTLGKGRYDPHNQKAFTYCNAIKQRMNGQVTTITARLVFDFKTNNYLDGYSLGHLDTKAEATGYFTQIEPTAYPRWAKNHRRKPLKV